jgi:phosphatidate cytidylyltransferase
MRDMGSSILTGLILGAILLVAVIVDPLTFALLISAATVVAVWELSVAFKKVDITIPVIPVCLSSIVMIFSVIFGGMTLMMVIFILSASAIFLYSSLEKRIRDRHFGYMSGIFVLTYIPLMLSFYMLLRTENDGILKIVLIVLGVVCSDTGGLLVGSRIGVHKMSPVISPKKTWEGLVGSLVFCTIATYIYSYFAFPSIFYLGQLWVPLLLSILIVLVGTFGDLAESVIKREVDVKDIGGLLPGHGGILDRIDSLIILAPFAYFFVTFFIR